MRILFAVKPHLPAVGGAQQTMHWLALGLQRRGHEVAVLASSSPHPEQRAQPPELSYPLTVSAQPERVLPELAEAFGADVVVAGAYDESCARTTRLLLRASAPRPTVLHVHDAAGAPLADEHPAAIVAVSEHVRGLIEARGAAATVSLPPLEHAHYRVASSRRTALLINPVPKKGVDRLLALAAARPDVPFALTLAWHMSRNSLTRLRVRVGRLDNVELRDRTDDPAVLYGDARVLLAPSPYPEAWGRVVSEAQASGIPALVAHSGGLPEAVGGGGIAVPADASDADWLAAFSRLWDDTAAYARFAAVAEREGRRDELTLDGAARSFEVALEAALAAGREYVGP